jgi:AcrR family transcriptional regulator
VDTPRKRPRQQRSRDTVAAVLEAAAQVFEREGYTATTNRIAERAGVSIGTVYQYFPNKRALLYALAEQHLTAAHERLSTLFAELDRTRPGWEGTVRAVATAVAALHADRPRLHALLYEYTPRPPEGVARLHELYRMVIREVAEHLRRHGPPDEDAEHTAALLVHAADAQLHRILLGTNDLAEQLTSTLRVATGRGAAGPRTGGR